MPRVHLDESRTPPHPPRIHVDRRHCRRARRLRLGHVDCRMAVAMSDERRRDLEVENRRLRELLWYTDNGFSSAICDEDINGICDDTKRCGVCVPCRLHAAIIPPPDVANEAGRRYCASCRGRLTYGETDAICDRCGHTRRRRQLVGVLGIIVLVVAVVAWLQVLGVW